MPYLGTTPLLRQLARAIEAGHSIPTWSGVETERFLRIGHAFAAILHGVAGGMLGLVARESGADRDREGPGEVT